MRRFDFKFWRTLQHKQFNPLLNISSPVWGFSRSWPLYSTYIRETYIIDLISSVSCPYLFVSIWNWYEFGKTNLSFTLQEAQFLWWNADFAECYWQWCTLSFLTCFWLLFIVFGNIVVCMSICLRVKSLNLAGENCCTKCNKSGRKCKKMAFHHGKGL